MMKKLLIAAGIAVAIVIAIAGVYLSSLTEPAPEEIIESTTPQTSEQPAEPTSPTEIVVEVEETLGFSEGP